MEVRNLIISSKWKTKKRRKNEVTQGLNPKYKKLNERSNSDLRRLWERVGGRTDQRSLTL